MISIRQNDDHVRGLDKWQRWAEYHQNKPVVLRLHFRTRQKSLWAVEIKIKERI